MKERKKIKHSLIFMILFCLFLVFGCGGGESSTPTPTPQIPTPEPSKPKPDPEPIPLPTAFNMTALALSATKPRTLIFSWNKSANANSYTLCQADSSKSNNCQVLLNNISGQTTEYTFTEIVDASITDKNFFILANNATGATPSDEMNPKLSDYIGMIGYLKALNIDSDDRFGYSVSLSNDGNTLAVGAIFEDSNNTNQTDNDTTLNYNSGAVYVFTRSTDNSWSQQAYLKASNIGSDDRFGYSVSLSNDGNTLAVGAIFEDSNNTNQTDNTSTNSGAVYVFTRSTDNSWSTPVYLKASNISAYDQFGSSVSLSNDGNTLAVGASLEDGTEVDSGAVYVFTRGTDNSWSTPVYLKALNIGADDRFGSSLSLSNDGNTLAVGAVFEGSNSQNTPSNNSLTKSGAVYVFTRSTDNSWSEPFYLKASNIGTGDRFGYSVSLSSDSNTLAVGAHFEDGTEIDSGAVYVFTRNTDNSWLQQAYLKASNIGADNYFGLSVSLSNDGDTLAVGASNEGSSSPTTPNENSDNSGAVYVFTRSTDNIWSQTSYLKTLNIGAGDNFGYSISLSGDANTLVGGALYEDSNDKNNPDNGDAIDSGAVYIF